MPRTRIFRMELWIYLAAVLTLLSAAGNRSLAQEKQKLAEPNAAARRLYSTAANAQNEDNFQFAVKRWEQFLEKYPNTELTPKAQHYTGICYRQLGEFEKAAKHFDVVAKKWIAVPNFALGEEALLNLGWCLFTQAKSMTEGSAAIYAQAADAFARQLAKYPKGDYLDQALYFQGESFYRGGKTAEAIAPYSRLVNDTALKDSPLRADATYALGVTHEEQSQFVEAGKIYDVFIRDYSKDALLHEVKMRKGDTLLQRGLAAKKSQTPDAAKPLLEAALKQFGEVAQVKGFKLADRSLYNQATCQVELDQFLEAAQLFAKVVSQFADSSYVPSATINAGKFYYQGKASEEALQWLNKVVQSDPGNAAEAAHLAARIHLASKAPDKAYELCSRVLPKAGQSPFVANLKMDQADAAWAIEGKQAESLALYLKLYEADPKHALAPQALYNAAFAGMDLKEYDAALQHCATFLKSFAENSFDADVKYVAAECHRLKGEFEPAEAGYTDLIAGYKDHADFPLWHVRLGNVLYNQEKFEPAISSLTDNLKLLGKPVLLAEAQYLVGMSHMALEQYDEAAAAMEKSFAADSTWRQADAALLAWSRALFQSEKTDDAIARLEQFFEKFPNSHLTDQGYYRLGQCYSAKGDHKQAVAQFSAVIEKTPDSGYAPAAYFDMGWSLFNQDQFKEAVATFTALIEKHPGNALVAEALFGRGMAGRQTEKYQEAVADFTAFLETELKGPRRCAALFERGRVHVKLKEFKTAAADFTALLEFDPKDQIADRAMYELAWSLKDDGQDEQALAAFRKLPQDYPDSHFAAEAYYHDGEALFNAEDYAGAAKVFSIAKEKAPKDALKEQASYKLAWTLYMRDQFDEAGKAFAAQMAAFPKGALYVSASHMLGESYFHGGDYANALTAFTAARGPVEKAENIADDLKATVLLHGGQSAASLEKWPEALKFLATIPEDFPDSSVVEEASFEKGRAHFKLGQLDEALAAFKKAADDPGVVGARALFQTGEVYFVKKEFEQAVEEFGNVRFGFGGNKAPDDIKSVQARAGYEGARCYEVRIKDAKEPQRGKLIESAIEFYTYVVEKHARSPYAAQAQERLKVLKALK